jgi:hypothetical protein
MTSSLDPLYRALDQTWPAAHHIQQDCWCLRVGMGGGKRVSAATLEGTLRTGSIDRAAQSMRDIGQPSLFMIRDNQETLDTELANRGYDICDPSHIYTTPVDKLTTQKPPRVSMFNIWEPLEIQKDIWRQGGIDDARLAVMERAEGEKTSILMRWENHPAGTAFVGLCGRLLFGLKSKELILSVSSVQKKILGLTRFTLHSTCSLWEDTTTA